MFKPQASEFFLFPTAFHNTEQLVTKEAADAYSDVWLSAIICASLFLTVHIMLRDDPVSIMTSNNVPKQLSFPA